MDVLLKKGNPTKQKTACLVVGVNEGKKMSPAVAAIDAELDKALRKAMRRDAFSGKVGQTFAIDPATGLKAERVLFVGLGAEKKTTGEVLRRAVGTALKNAGDVRATDMMLVFESFELRHASDEERARVLTEGLLLGGYRFDRYLTSEESKKEKTPKVVTFQYATIKQEDAIRDGVAQAQAICRGVVLARDLVNEPGNVKSPTFLAEQAAAAGKETGFKCTILDQQQLEQENMGAMLGVAQGSEREPCLIVMEYNGGKKGEAPVALVGKGVVFDSGGISIKPSEGMEEMKMDMGGAAAVIGTLTAAALLKLPCNLVGVVPAVENMPSGSAIRPGDILTSASGKTIEVLNTDAEGRLILADALNYVSRYKPETVIDLATLTGACIIALGHEATAVLGNDDKLASALIGAGERAGERAWQLPLWDEYSELIKSDVADVKNIGGRPAGTITAAAFLQKFAEEYSWAHLDIAGTAWADSAKPCYPKGGTGVGVRLLIEYLKNASK